MPDPSAPFVIVGAGLAGASAAASLRESGHAGEIIMIGAEPQPPYHRPPLSKEYLRGETDGPSPVHDDGFYERQKIELRTSARVTEIDAHQAEVELADGERIPYQRLLIATGAEPRPLEVGGSNLEGVHYLRRLEQSNALGGALEEGTQLVIIGAGWIGVEVAASARQIGADVTMLEATSFPLERVVGHEVGAFIRDRHQTHGVDFRDRTSVESIEGNGSVQRVRLTSGEAVEADLVLVAIGARPVAEVADAAGLSVDNGIVVDAGLRSADPRIFAAGDVANSFHPFYGHHLRVEHWTNAEAQGRAAGKAMLDHPVSYEEIPYFFSDQYELGLEYWGHAADWDEVVQRGDVESGAFVTFWLREGTVVAAMSVNISELGTSIEQLIRSRHAVDREHLADSDVPLADVAGAVGGHVR